MQQFDSFSKGFLFASILAFCLFLLLGLLALSDKLHQIENRLYKIEQGAITTDSLFIIKNTNK